MWGEVLHWLLLSMVPFLLYHEPLSLKPLCQPMVIAEMPSQFYSPLDGILPQNSMRDVYTQNISAANSGCQIQTLWLFWFTTITSTLLPFVWARQ